MTLGCDKSRWTQDAEGLWVCLRADNPQAARRLCKLMEKEPGKYQVEVKKARKKRSLDANAYAWELIGKLADVLRKSKDEIYLEMLKSYGQGGVVKIPDAQAENVLRAIKYWEPHENLAPEKKAQYYRVWAGSSNYNTREMSIFIDGIIDECQQQEIETRTPEELALMKARWEDEKHSARRF